MKRVLVIANDLDVLATLNLLLESNKYKTVCTQDPDQGLSLLKYCQDISRTKFDAIVVNTENNYDDYLEKFLVSADSAKVIALDCDYIKKRPKELIIINSILNYTEELLNQLQQLTPSQ
ncbi:MAG: hypothetical protein WCW02_02220 [Candidatus Buchananbacteria bacterium]